MDDKALFKLSYGLFVLTARQDGKDNGCIINTAIQAADGKITVAVNKQNLTHDMILATGAFTVSVLSEKASFDLFKHFGFQSGRGTDKFDGFTACQRGENGLLYVTEGTNAFISGKVIDTVDLGSHTLFVATISDMEVLDTAPSATYAYYHASIKPKPAAQPPQEKTVWRCTVCGYVYDESDELPADFVCPWCKHPASDFEKVSG